MSKKSSQTQQTNSVAGPWPYAVPAAQGFVDKLSGLGGIGITPDQQAAFATLKNNAAQGNPYAGQLNSLAQDSFNTADRSGMVGDAYKTLQSQLGGYASGQYLDPMSNPQMQAMMKQVGDDAFNRINAQFAGAGRDMSGMNQLAAARGVTQAQLPLLLDQYNRAQDQQMQAAQMLYGAGSQTAQTQSALDQSRQAMRAQGGTYGQQALDARNYAANNILNLDQQIKAMPYEDMSLLASLLFPAASLGGTQRGVGQATGSMSLFSDERLKENISEVGKLADGQKVYAYNYKGDPATQIGVMAQEVEKKHPEAVTDTASGYKAVNYRAATDHAARIVAARRKGGKR